MMKCETCRANKVCDHDRFGFENCGSHIPEGDCGESDIKRFAYKLMGHLEEEIEGCGYPDSSTQPIAYGSMLGLKYALSLVQALSADEAKDKK